MTGPVVIESLCNTDISKCGQMRLLLSNQQIWNNSGRCPSAWPFILICNVHLSSSILSQTMCTVEVNLSNDQIKIMDEDLNFAFPVRAYTHYRFYRLATLFSLYILFKNIVERVLRIQEVEGIPDLRDKSMVDAKGRFQNWSHTTYLRCHAYSMIWSWILLIFCFTCCPGFVPSPVVSDPTQH